MRAGVLGLALLCAAVLAAPGWGAGAPVQRISIDRFTNPDSQHETQVEPDSFAYGSTIVSAFQVGRYYASGGASGIGFATSKDGGQTWTEGVLPLLTVNNVPAGRYQRATDPSVAYDEALGVWLVSSLVLSPPCVPDCRSGIVVSRSTDGLTWSAPVTIVPQAASFQHDKNWTTCDNWPGSPFRGRCYTSYSDFSDGSRRILTTRSLDGGRTWSGPVASPDPDANGLGAIPISRPDGSLVVTFLAGDAEDRIGAIRSTDGGATFGGIVVVAPALAKRFLPEDRVMRRRPLPSVEIDAAGTIYAAWADCSFRAGCSSEDVVLSRSLDGITWTAPARVPIDGVDSGADHFIPSLAVDPSTAGSTTRLAITYYYFPVAACSVATCQLRAGFIASKTAGASWEAPLELSPAPMAISSIPDTTQGRMVGDYVATSFAPGGVAVPLLPLAQPRDSSFRLAMHAARIPLAPPPPPPPAPPPPAPPPPAPAPAPAPAPSPAPPPAPPAVVSAAPKLLLSAPSASPARPVAGRRFTLRVRARLGAAGTPLAGGRPLCSARLGTRALGPAARTLRRGLVTCTWRIPAAAAGQRLLVRAGATAQGRAAQRARSFRVAG